MDDYYEYNQESEQNDNKQKAPLPKIFIVLRIIACCFFAVGVVLLVIGICMPSVPMSADNWFEATTQKDGFMFGSIPCFMVGGFLMFVGFIPSITKVGIKMNKHIVTENEEDLTYLSSKGGDIVSPGITKVAKAVKSGLNESDSETVSSSESKYCANCGKKIPKAANFCSNCGSKQ
ncbi:MAG: zinc ribbon domain-containing protein [Clostridia bacterium]|nr:zinc ribbon domain-containing protein [Clostridia bacterium]